MMSAIKLKMKRAMQAYGTSVGITLGQLGYVGSDQPIRNKIAIERVQPELPFGVLDPREVVARRIILTIPLSELRPTGERSLYVPN
jgi:hypothetical protein